MLLMLIPICLAILGLGVLGVEKGEDQTWEVVVGDIEVGSEEELEIGEIELSQETTQPKISITERSKQIDEAWERLRIFLPGLSEESRNNVWNPGVGWLDFDDTYRGTVGLSGKYTWPIKDDFVLTSCFGRRTLQGRLDCTDGIDLSGVEGVTSVYPITNGVVHSICEGYCGGFGNTILIKHNDGKFSRYSHMAYLDVTEGVSVSIHTVLGAVGSTGYSTGPHLDLKIYLDENIVSVGDAGVNPICYLERKDITVMGNCPADPWDYCSGDNLVKSAKTYCSE